MASLHSLVPLGHIGGHEIAFTNSALYMGIVVLGAPRRPATGCWNRSRNCPTNSSPTR